MTKEELKAAITEAFDEERKSFWVDSETHYQHHKWVGGWIWGIGIAKKSVITAFVAGLLSGLGVIIWLGIQAAIRVKGIVAG